MLVGLSGGFFADLSILNAKLLIPSDTRLFMMPANRLDNNRTTGVRPYWVPVTDRSREINLLEILK